MTSPDAITWTRRTGGSSNAWYSVTFGEGNFVSVARTGTSGKRVMTSTDGTTWTLRDTPVDNLWRSVTYANGLFVAVASSGSGNGVMTSGSFLLPPSISLSASTESKPTNTSISGYAITSTGGTIASYAISPAPAAGLSFNTSTGTLSGTPTTSSAATTYTITATNSSGSTSATFTLTITSDLAIEQAKFYAYQGKVALELVEKFQSLYAEMRALLVQLSELLGNFYKIIMKIYR
jgi:hypothetical protein